MNKQEKVKIWYKDDTQVRQKDLILLKMDYGIITFFNERTQKKEMIPINNIVRIEGEKENENINIYNNKPRD